jgi:hypothetical protein
MGRTSGSSPDWRGVSRSSGSSNGSRRTRSQKAGGRSSGSSCRVLGWSSRWRGESRGPAGVWKTQKGQINRSRPGPRSLQWSQAGTAGLREYQPHNQGKARPGNRDSEGPSKQRPRPGSCDRKPFGRGVTSRSKTRTGFGHPGPTPAHYSLVWNPLHVSSLLFKLPVTTFASSSSSKAAAFIRGDRSSSVAPNFLDRRFSFWTVQEFIFEGESSSLHIIIISFEVIAHRPSLPYLHLEYLLLATVYSI